MGYTENACQICAVSINTARLRLKHEPESDGWGYSGGAYYAGDSYSSRCTVFASESGCVTEDNQAREGEYAPDEIHYPGRGCTYYGGYNGHKISAEEMRGMNHPRYICLKPDNASPEKDETEYEKRSKYFLTTCTTEPPDDFEPGRLERVRFGAENFFPQNYSVLGATDDSETGIPVHAACWDIFERVSHCRGDKLGVDLNGFMALWERQACGMCGFQGLKQDAVISKCREQWWQHLPGTEYLAANPCNIPGFIPALLEVFSEYPKGDWLFGPRTDNGRSSKSNATDCFRKLPAEIRAMILCEISSKDLASLRLASRTFRQVAKSVFYRLIKEELPWFWEFEELQNGNAHYWKRMLTPGRLEDMRLDNQKPIQSINWYQIYLQLRILKGSLLGVKNRARVWNVCEEIVSRIQQLREDLGKPRTEDRMEDTLHIRLTREEVASKSSKNGLYCPRCSSFIE